MVYVSAQLEFCMQLFISHALAKMEIIWKKPRVGKKRSYAKNGVV